MGEVEAGNARPVAGPQRVSEPMWRRRCSKGLSAHVSDLIELKRTRASALASYEAGHVVEPAFGMNRNPFIPPRPIHLTPFGRP